MNITEKSKKFPKLRKSYKEKPKSSKENMKEILSDPRFAHIGLDPRYRNVPKKQTKIQIDDRFKSAFTDEKFNTKSILDPRGKPKNYTTRETLDKFYDLESLPSESDTSSEEEEEETDENDGEQVEEEQTKGKKISEKVVTRKREGKKKTFQHSEEQVKSKEGNNVNEEFMHCLLNPERNLARGEQFYSDDSSDDDSSTTDEEEDDIATREFEWGELDGDAQWDVNETEVEETSRFAVCDMDWDRIKAVDLMVLLSSFAPPGGTVNRVVIFPSEFGKQRMKEEELTGPIELVNLNKRKQCTQELEDLDKLKKGTLDESTAASSKQIEALRRYQRNRLRYFYAVVECDSLETAQTIYKEVDRTHYEVAGINLDLRYIPSDMEFDEVPRDECHEVPDTYDSEPFQTTALLDTKPTLTWDETDRRRKKTLATAMAKALKKQSFDEEILKDYVASSEEEDDTDNETEDEEDEEEDGKCKEARIAKFRALISEIDEKEKKKTELSFDKEDTFAFRERESEDDGSEEEEEEKPREREESNSLTPFEKFLLKKKEKMKEKRKKKAEKEECESEEGIEPNDGERKTLKSDPSVSKRNKNRKKNKDKFTQDSTIINSDLSLLVMEEEENDKKHFDMRKIREEKIKAEMKNKKKRKRNEEELNIGDDFKVDSGDPRFASLFTHSSFNLDPSHPKYDPNSSFNAVVASKGSGNKKNKQATSKSNLDSDVSNLVKKIKLKTLKLK